MFHALSDKKTRKTGVFRAVLAIFEHKMSIVHAYASCVKNNHKLCSISQSPGLKSDILHGNYLPYRQQPSASTHIFCSQCAYQRTQHNQLYHIYGHKSRIYKKCICKFLMNDNFLLTISFFHIKHIVPESSESLREPIDHSSLAAFSAFIASIPCLTRYAAPSYSLCMMIAHMSEQKNTLGIISYQCSRRSPTVRYFSQKP